MNYAVCSCGARLVSEAINCAPEKGAMKQIATATICIKCRKVIEIEMMGDSAFSLWQVERVYKATKTTIKNFTEEELKTGNVVGFCSSKSDYNPDAHLEPKGE